MFSQKAVAVAPDESDPAGADPMMPCGLFFRARYSHGGIGSNPAQSPDRESRASISAWAELDEIEPLERANPSVIAMRLRILERMARFETGVEIARGAVRLHPEDLDIRLLGAVHIRRATGIREALRFLQDSPETFRGHGGYWFAIACLHCQLGDLDRTAECTRHAVDLDRRFRMRVLDHLDLETLRASWCAEE